MHYEPVVGKQSAMTDTTTKPMSEEQIAVTEMMESLEEAFRFMPERRRWTISRGALEDLFAEIRRLRADQQRLCNTLRPFAFEGHLWSDDRDLKRASDDKPMTTHTIVGQWRNAAVVLREVEGDNSD